MKRLVIIALILSASVAKVLAQTSPLIEQLTSAIESARDAGNTDDVRILEGELYRIRGIHYANGVSVSQDYEEAVKWYQLSAELGNSFGQALLGAMYEEGTGVTQNYREASKWYRLAAEQGHSQAQILLGSLYLNGRGVAQNDQEAVKWFNLAAAQGMAEAQYILGSLYSSGVFLQKDIQRAYLWLSLAAAQGLISAEELRDRVRVQLSPQALQEAQALATRCFESDFKDCGE